MHKPGFVSTIVIAATVAFATAASAGTLKKDIYACTSERFVSEMLGFQNAKDRNGVKGLIESGKCIYIDQGEKVSIVRPGIMMATILYQGKTLYTTADALR